MVRISFLLVLFSSLVGCVGTMSGAYETFGEDLERLASTSFETSYVYNIGHLSKLEPDEVKELSNGNQIKVFSIKPPRQQQCKVHIEVNANNVIVVATSEGSECWRAY